VRDGCRLAARIWLPVGAEREPVPAILEYLPYGKREGTRERDEPMHHYFAGHGYAALRVDVRGSGESEGLLVDEYSEEELRDALDVISWIASRPWCDGAVGMMGKSWGGFNALQVAALRPPALRGVVSVCASDDRYADDAHWMGGCLLLENFRWGAALFSLAAQPPDPALVGGGWRELWLERLRAAEPFAVRWLRHPLRDAFWRHGSVCEDFSAIACPVWAVGGWADAYTNAIPRLLAGLGVPRRGLVGPWAHLYPHEGTPGPAIGFLQEALGWWDHCLRGAPLADEPLLRAWMPDGALPAGARAARPGRWVSESGWPSPRIERRRLALGARGLGDAAAAGEQERRICSPASTGAAAGAWCAFGPGGLPGDQRPDDARSLCFDSPPLDERLEILGAPSVRLVFRADGPVAQVAVRLCDVAPDGASTRVTYGLANLTHSPDHAHFQPLVPGARHESRVVLNDAAWSFPPGHRLRLAVSSAYWPLAWPAPAAVTLGVITGVSSLELPVRPPRAEDAALREFAPPEAAPRPEVLDLEPGGVDRQVTRDPETGAVVRRVRVDLDETGRPGISRVAPIDLDVGYGIAEELSILDGDPLSAEARIRHVSVARRGDWSVQVETRTRVSASADALRVEAELSASEGGAEVFARSWDERVPRRGF
jgi:putative CocE/NonD family hydrolase